VPGFVQMSSLRRALRIDQQKLRELNPHCCAPSGTDTDTCQRRITALPMDGDKWTSDLLAARLSPNEFFAGQPEPRHHRVRRGDTVASVADQYGVTTRSARASHRMRTSASSSGRVINLPESTAGTLVAVQGRLRQYRCRTTCYDRDLWLLTRLPAPPTAVGRPLLPVSAFQRWCRKRSAASADASATAAAANAKPIPGFP